MNVEDGDIPLPGDTWTVNMETGNECLKILNVMDVDIYEDPASYMVMDSDSNAFEMSFDDIVAVGEKVN